MTEENRIILEQRYTRHEWMIHCTFMIALLSTCLALAAYVRTL